LSFGFCGEDLVTNRRCKIAEIPDRRWNFSGEIVVDKIEMMKRNQLSDLSRNFTGKIIVAKERLFTGISSGRLHVEAEKSRKTKAM
jgi:hypothetical protein